MCECVCVCGNGRRGNEVWGKKKQNIEITLALLLSAPVDDPGKKKIKRPVTSHLKIKKIYLLLLDV